MSFFKRLVKRLRKPVKYSASDPHNFEERWSFQSNTIRLISLIIVVIILVGGLSAYLFAKIFAEAEYGSPDRIKLEEQRIQIESIKSKLDAQDKYIDNLRAILSGEVPAGISVDPIESISTINVDSLSSKETPAEKLLAKKVKEDIRTPVDDKSHLTYFGSPITGVISQGFDAKKHPAIDVVASKDEVIKACLAGTVIYTGYTRKDGYIAILEHTDGFISVYKHNKTVLKKIGSKVQLGDPIAIIGNTGENTDGPHLHFELWYHQVPVNPADYIKFTR